MHFITGLLPELTKDCVLGHSEKWTVKGIVKSNGSLSSCKL